MSLPLLGAFIGNALLTVFFLARFFKARRDCIPEVQSVTLAGTLLALALCIFIGCLAFLPTEHGPNCDAVVTTPYCEQCGEQIDATTTCASCGEKLETPFCGSCGASADLNS